MTSGPHLLLHSSIKMHHLSGVHATLSLFWLSPSCTNGRIQHDIVSVTALTILPCHLSWLLTLTGGLWSQWPLQCGATGQSWPSSSTSQESLGLWLECIFTPTWQCPGHGPIHPVDSFQLSLHPVTALTQLTGCSSSFSVSLLSGPYGHLICVWAGEPVPRGSV